MVECDVCQDVSFELKADFMRHLKTKKHLDHYNDEQKMVLLHLHEYINSTDIRGESGLRINSAGGTGKTYTVSSLLKYINNIVSLGPTNQAVNVLNKSFNTAKTFHSFFGWSQDIDENNKEISVWKVPNIPKNTIFVLDEISMMTIAQFSLFKHYIYGKFKFILMGDSAQLPPFETKDQDTLPSECPLVKNTQFELSLFFQFKCVELHLKKNMRTKNVLLNSQISRMREDVLNNKQVDLTVNWKLDYNLIKQNINREYIVIAHKNDDVNRFNIDIREALTPNAGELEIGDKICLSKFYLGLDKEMQKTILLGNGTRYTVRYFHIETKTLKNILDDDLWEFDVYYIELNDDIVIYKVLDKDCKKFLDYKRYNESQIKKLKENNGPAIDIQRPKEMDGKTYCSISLVNWKKKLYKALRAICGFHCYYNFGFASTINKAQGASFDIVFVYLTFSKFFGNKQKYTAASRVVNDLRVFTN